MPARCPDPEWYVYVDDFNKKEIEKFNVFQSLNFLEGCKRTFKKYKDIDIIEKEIKSWAMYSFWSKCEYEIVLTSLFNSERHKFKDEKIDVYDQLLMNWDSFFRYVVEHKAYFLRRQE